MNNTSPQELDGLARNCLDLIHSQQTLIMSTASANNIPNISYAPFVRDQYGTFYVYLSEMAEHTGNLLNNPQASVLLIRPESESPNLFARERAIFNCIVRKIARDDEAYPIRLQALNDKFGAVISLLRTLTDFHLFALQPQSGRYIAGFGKAFTITIDDGRLSLKR